MSTMQMCTEFVFQTMTDVQVVLDCHSERMSLRFVGDTYQIRASKIRCATFHPDSKRYGVDRKYETYQFRDEISVDPTKVRVLRMNNGTYVNFKLDDWESMKDGHSKL